VPRPTRIGEVDKTRIYRVRQKLQKKNRINYLKDNKEAKWPSNPKDISIMEGN
jgi:hypothetical protein